MSRGLEEIQVTKELIVNNLLGRSEKAEQYLHEETEGLEQFLKLNRAIEVTVDEVLES